MPILTNAINANATTPLLPIQGGSGVSSPTAHGILIAEGAGAYNPIVLNDGELLIGSTGADPVAATLTAGTGIDIDISVPGAITITNTETGAPTWNLASTATALVAGNSYFANVAGQTTFTLPTTAVLGDTFQVAGDATNVGGWIIAQNALQAITLGNSITTAGVTGSITSEASAGNWIEIVCAVTNTGFVANLKQGQATSA
jgi:hypothetical protein